MPHEKENIGSGSLEPCSVTPAIATRVDVATLQKTCGCHVNVFEVTGSGH